MTKWPPTGFILVSPIGIWSSPVFSPDGHSRAFGEVKQTNGEEFMARVTTYFAVALLSAVAFPAAAQIADFRPVTEAMLANPDPGDWLMLSRTFDQQRFSPLNQIDKTNVGQLRMAWARGLPVGTQESTPIVYQRRHVSVRAGRQRAGGRRHQRRSDLGIRQRDYPQGRSIRGRRATRASASTRT